MQQSSATQSLHLSFWGLQRIVACSHSSSQCLLVSTVFGTVSSLHPTSFLYLYYITVCVVENIYFAAFCTLYMFHLFYNMQYMQRTLSLPARMS